VEDGRKLDRYVATSQVGITVSSLVLGSFGQSTIAPLISPILEQASLGRLTQPLALSISATGVLILLTILQVVLGELAPKSVSLQFPEKIALFTVIPMKWSEVLFGPLIWLFNGSGNVLLHLFGVRSDGERGQIHSPEEIELLVSESHQGGLLDDQAQQMVRNVFRLRGLMARHVMLPRTRLTTAPAASTVADLLDLACTEGYSRIPLYESTIDNIVGFVHIKDLFRLHLHGQTDPAEIIRDVIYIPEALPIVAAWTRLNSQGQYIAVVLDEYGGTAGLITVEDLIEEIFGELQDEFDEELPLVASDKDGRIYLRGDLLVTDLNEYLGLKLPEEEADTLGGLVFSRMGRLPRKGQEIVLGEPGLSIRVEATASRSITEVSLQLPESLSHGLRIGEWEVASHD
jgi:CBS domain containing-hemolysin-like protein